MTSFLETAASRSLALRHFDEMSDEAARTLFKAIRWARSGGDPVCPKCGSSAVYTYASRPIYRCQMCSCQFSDTSGTLFHSRKLSIKELLKAFFLFSNGAKGQASLQLSRLIGVQYKTAFVLQHKIREAMKNAQVTFGVGGETEVEIDGAYFGGHVRPANWHENRKDRRKAENQTGKRQVVVVTRERGETGRTRTYVTPSEAAAVPVIRNNIPFGTVVHADEALHWDGLHYDYETYRINHSQVYSTPESNTNQAESFFSRLRRAEIGIYHHIAGRYFDRYAAEMAWREDVRRMPNGHQFLLLIAYAAWSGSSAIWRGYWQHGARVIESG